MVSEHKEVGFSVGLIDIYVFADIIGLFVIYLYIRRLISTNIKAVF